MSAEQGDARDQLLDTVLSGLTARIPYIGFLGVKFDRAGEALTARLPFREMLIGNPLLPALHGGASGAFLEVTAVVQLGWIDALRQLEHAEGPHLPEGYTAPLAAKPIDISIDYLRSGKPRDAFARATVLRQGRRVANVRVEAWQDAPNTPFIAGHGHFLIQRAR